MSSFDSGATLAERMRAHAADRTHLYAVLMRAMASDWEAGGPTREICRGWEDSPEGSVVQLRLLAGVFRIVLTGRAPQLEPYYACLGGTAPPDEAWPTFREVLAAHVHELQEALLLAPQTNEVGRSLALLVGLFRVVQRTGLRKIRLLEPGASAGLNLLVDEFRYAGEGWTYGPAGSPLVLTGVVGTVTPRAFDIVDRRGCDLSPIDLTDDSGGLRLRSFVWPFQVERHHRLEAALLIARDHPVHVDRSAAGEWLELQLDRPSDGDVLTVVWHSITRMYWPPAETERVEAAIAAAGTRRPVAHVSMEYPTLTSTTGAELRLAVHTPGEAVQIEVLAHVGDHGPPVTLLA
jgi:hypothetical protein